MRHVLKYMSGKLIILVDIDHKRLVKKLIGARSFFFSVTHMLMMFIYPGSLPICLVLNYV